MTVTNTPTTDIKFLVSPTTKRPILTHLTADNTWLISFPHPAPSIRKFYHILLDPWLESEAVAYYRWLITIFHTTKPVFTTIASIRDLILQIEQAAGSPQSQPFTPFTEPPNSPDTGEPDLSLISHHNEDHCNHETLSQLSPTTPIYTSAGAAPTLASWSHKNVAIMPDLSLDSIHTLWQTPHTSPLPPFLHIGRLSAGNKLDLHFAVVIAYTTANTTETILFAPHGIYESRISDLTWANTHSTFLALLHGLDPAFSPMAANLGVENGRKLVQKLNPRYWIPTHDEHLAYQGIVGWFQTKYKMEWPEMDGDVVCRDVSNGESLVLL